MSTPAAGHSRSFDQRRRPVTPRTALESALRCPTNMTSRADRTN
jgi:hypothetical protein